MRLVAGGLIAGAALLGSAPLAMAGLPAQPTVPAAPVSSASADGQATPRAEVSMVAVSLTVGGALATAGSGMALVLARRRAVSRAPSQASG